MPMKLINDYFDSNLALLKERHSQAWQAVADFTGAPFGEFCFAEDGKPTLLGRKESGEEIFLHDRISPEAELPSYYALVPEASTGVVFFLGIGLGYAPLALLKTRRQIRHLTVLEPQTAIFVQALHALDLAPLLNDKRVIIAVGADINVPQLIEPLQRSLTLEDIHILNNVPSAKLFPEIYEGLYNEVYKHVNVLNVSGGTVRHFGGKFIDNRLRHLSAIHHQYLLEHLHNVLVGVPAIIIAGGPSLNKNIHLLAEAKGKAVIIAADTVLPALLKHGVTPDFTCAIDMQDIVVEKIVDVSAAATGTALVCVPWVNPTIPKNFPARQVYWTFTGKHMEKWLNELLGGKLLTSGAGTVAHLSFTTAFLLGCSPIVFVGQDLAFTDRQDHAQHTSLRSRTVMDSFFARNDIQWVEAYGGVGKVPTDRGWFSDKHHFEQLIASADDRVFINATEGGVRIEGTKECPLQEVLDSYCRQQVDIQGIIETADSHSKMADRRRMIDEFGRLLKEIADIERDMGRIDLLTARVKEVVAKLPLGSCRNFNSLPPVLRKQISELDTLNVRLDKTKIWALLDDVTMDGLLQSERLNYEIKQLEDLPDRYLEWIAMSVDRFIVINQCRQQVLVPVKQRLKQLHSGLQRENIILKKVAGNKKGYSREALLALLRLYFESGDHALMEKMIITHCPDHAESAELSFYLGVIAAHQSQFDKAEKFFSRAVALDQSWAARIKKCRYQLAEQYLVFGQEWQVQDQVVACRMLFKGVRHCLDHPALCEAIVGQADQLLAEVENAAGQGAMSTVEVRLAGWYSELLANPDLQIVIGVDRAAALYFVQGQFLFGQDDFSGALACYQEAATLTPRDARIQVAIFEAAFNLGRFDLGTAVLAKAVALDPTLARHWEELGDLLLTSQQPNDALAAYEQCFAAQPEQVYLLKKIGDCYLALNQLEAAREAYRFYQQKALNSGVNE